MLRHGVDIEGIVVKITTPQEVLELLKGAEGETLTSERVLEVFRSSFAKKIALLREYGYETLVYTSDELRDLRSFVGPNNEPDLGAWEVLQSTVGKIRDLIARNLTSEGFKVIGVEQNFAFDSSWKPWQKVLGHPDWLVKIRNEHDPDKSPFKIFGKGRDRRLEMPDLRHENLVDEHIIPAIDLDSASKRSLRNPYGFFTRQAAYSRNGFPRHPGVETLSFAPNLGEKLRLLATEAPGNENIKILLDALEGYKHLLSLGLLHRDFHPANIAVVETPGGLVGKVFDFEGLGRVGYFETVLGGMGLFNYALGQNGSLGLHEPRMVLEFLLCNVMACFIPYNELYRLARPINLSELEFHTFIRKICAGKVPDPILEILLKMAKEQPEERATLEEVTECLQDYLQSCAVEVKV